MVHTEVQEAICPACGHQGLEYNAEQIDLPFLGSSLETMLRCPACGYRHVDFVLLETKDPQRALYKITEADDMMVRVVRSSSGTIRIPELGVLIEPGISSEAFISNIEGILVRIERVLDQLYHDAEEEEMKQRITDLQDRIDKMRAGTAEPATLILEDPFGNSAILGEKAVHEPIPAEEAAKLKVGMMVIDPQGEILHPEIRDEEE